MRIFRWIIIALLLLFIVSKMGFAREVTGKVVAVLVVNVTNQSITIQTRDLATNIQIANVPGLVETRLEVRNFTEDLPTTDTNCTFLEEIVKSQSAQTRSIILESVDNVKNRIDGNLNITCPQLICPEPNSQEVQECRSRLNATDLSLNSCLQSNLLKDGQCQILDKELENQKYVTYFFGALLAIIIFLIFKDDLIRNRNHGSY